MSDKTWSVKVDEETKDKIQELIDNSGLSSKELFQQLITDYQMEQAKHQSQIAKADLEELQNLTARINSIFINISEKATNIVTTIQNHTLDEIQSKQDIIESLNQRVNSFEIDKTETSEQIECLIQENKELKMFKEQTYTTYVNQMEMVNHVDHKNEILIKEYQDKISMMASKIESYEQVINDSEQLIEENSKLKNQISDQQIQNANLQKTISVLHQEAEKHLEHQKSVLELQRQQEILELKQNHQMEMQTQQDSYSTKMKELLDIYQSQIHKTVPKIPKVTKMINSKNEIED